MYKQKRVVVKVGSSTLTHENGKINLRRMEMLARVLADLHNRGSDVVLVSSGAQSVGVGKLGLKEWPSTIMEKQAVCAVGQCELMNLYDRFFNDYGQTVGQVLLTLAVLHSPERKALAVNTFTTLLSFGAIPVVNENDSVAVEEIEFGDNDTLSAIVATLVSADLLILLTDVDGLYDSDPRKSGEARLISRVDKVDDRLLDLGGAPGTRRGTGGMVTKIAAAKIATEAGIDMIIMNGSRPEFIYDLFEGRKVGTLFKAQE